MRYEYVTLSNRRRAFNLDVDRVDIASYIIVYEVKMELKCAHGRPVYSCRAANMSHRSGYCRRGIDRERDRRVSLYMNDAQICINVGER